MLPSYTSNSIFLVSRKDIIHKGFLELSRQVSGKVAVAKTPLLNFVFWLARLLTSSSPLKRLVLKFPILGGEGGRTLASAN